MPLQRPRAPYLRDGTGPRTGVLHGRLVVRRVVGGVVIVHGLLHLLGAAKGLRWSVVAAPTSPISPEIGAAWLLAALVVGFAGIAIMIAPPRWWLVCALAAVGSQAVIATSWSDAGAGTVINLVLIGAAVYGWASEGPRSFAAEYSRRASTALATSAPLVPERRGPILTEYDLASLPGSVAAYLRRVGVVGQPRVTSFRADIHGRIRDSSTSTWMPFTGEQVTTYGPDSGRLFSMDASLHGMPVDALHVFVGSAATMRVRAASLVPMVDAAGPQLDRAETVTFFNDLCVLAPAALVDADVTWTVLDADRVHAVYTRGRQTVAADLVFDDHEDLVDFVSDDRVATSSDGKTFAARRWSTPLTDYRDVGSRRVPTHGDAVWGGPSPDQPSTYLELTVDQIEYNVRRPPVARLAGSQRRRALPSSTAASTMSTVWQAPMHLVIHTVQTTLARHYVRR